ncbi:glycine cleavage system protein R [Nocardioides sp.]|uniref:glycine cleavage system protein R n=1 Tax=Nocardioides sp. TaxID=35761 RepID=UPI0035649E35
MATFILTLLGDDRPGLVSALSTPIKAHGGSWERSQLSQLEGKFAGIVVVSVPDAEYDGLISDLSALGDQGLKITIERTDETDPGDSVRLALHLLGADRPGIVAEISSALAALDVNIEELETDVHEAPMAGGLLFEANAVLNASSGARTDEIRGKLEALADELMVDIALTDD